MKRRSFLKNAAFLAGAAAMPKMAAACASGGGQAPPDLRVAKDLSFRSDGSFTLLQFTDTHYVAGDPRSARALDCVREAIEAVRPDFVIHTGDLVYGHPDLESAETILSPLAESGIPWAVCLGNHDAQFGSSREAMFRHIRSLRGCVNQAPKEGVYGCSNDVVTLSGAKGVERVFYLFDTMDAIVLRGEEELHCYDFLRHSQIGWYRAHSGRFAAARDGQPVPSLAFFHIPLREVGEGVAAGAPLTGNNGEPSCPSRLNSGMAAQFRELGDVEAVVTGHDHDCDYVLNYGQLFYIYGRYSGCDTVYNHLGHSGCRLFTFREGRPGMETCVRLYGGEIQQRVRLENHQILPVQL